jgi:hypothetical protein
MKALTFWCDCGEKHTVTLDDARYDLVANGPERLPGAVLLGPGGEALWEALRERRRRWFAASRALIEDVHGEDRLR